MTIVDQIDRITDWTAQAICAKVTLKRPDDDAVDGSYPYILVTPVALPLYFPGEERLPPKVTAPVPSICVQMMDGDSSAQRGTARIRVRYIFAAWNPGQHGPDNLGIVNHVTTSYTPPVGEKEVKPPPIPTQPSDDFRRDSEGWRDVWNFVDVAIRELESTNIINGIRLVREEPIRFGPVTEQDAVVDFYPYWYAWISFTVETPVIRNNPTHEKYL